MSLTDPCRIGHQPREILPPCMGGWCPHRESCARYHQAAHPGQEPCERLCEPARGNVFRPLRPQLVPTEAHRSPA